MQDKVIKSLGLLSDKMFFDFDQNFKESSEYFALSTPENPDFFWGNYLMFKSELEEGSFIKWPFLFDNEFSKDSRILHKTFSWAGKYDKQELEKFVQNNYDFSETIVLVAEAKDLKCPYKNKDIVCSIVDLDSDWKELVDFQIETNTDFNPDHYAQFINKRMNKYKSYVMNNHGNWYIAKINDRIVADLGLFWSGTLARFQNIKTHENYRKKGISQTLINFAVDNSKKDFFVIEAEEDGPAINMYKRVGFVVKEIIYSLCLYDKGKWDR